AVFAIVMIALGIQGLITGHLTAIWQPIPKWVPNPTGFAYLCAFISLSSGVGLIFRRTAGSAARTLLAYSVLWALVFRVPVIVRARGAFLAGYALAEPAVMIAATWVLYAWFATDWDRRHLGFAIGPPAVRAAQVMYGLCMVPFGIAHFTYLRRTAG